MLQENKNKRGRKEVHPIYKRTIRKTLNFSPVESIKWCNLMQVYQVKELKDLLEILLEEASTRKHHELELLQYTVLSNETMLTL